MKIDELVGSHRSRYTIGLPLAVEFSKKRKLWVDPELTELMNFIWFDKTLEINNEN